MQNKLASDRAIIYCLLPFFFLASYYLCLLNIDGDQYFYRQFYSAIEGISIYELPDISMDYMKSYEPLSIFVLWFGSNMGIDKDIFIALIDAALLALVVYFSRIHRVPWVLIGLVLTNFYLIVLLTAAERLKIAYLFLLIAAIYGGNIRFIAICLSILSHFTSLTIIAMIFFYSNILNRKKFDISRGYIVASLLLMFYLYYEFYELILWKFYQYFQYDINIYDIIKITTLFLIALYSTKEKLKMAFCFIPFYAVIIIFGGDRFNMLIFSFVVYILILEKRLTSPPMVMLLSYFSYKSIEYINNLILYGNGFA